MGMPWYEKYIAYRILLLHDKIYKATNGRIGHNVPGAPPMLILHTVGAKTGQQRANALAYARDGEDYLVVASVGGEPRAPGWYHNLKANPQVEINVGPTRLPATAHPVNRDDADYPRLWGIVNNMKYNKDRYNTYQKRTTRPIPVIRLTPS
jgi:F420H(2)-dependent quinone reductase